MGYMDISISGSDTASDLNHSIERVLSYPKPDTFTAIHLLFDALDKDNGKYNTQGCVNVALILTEGGHKFKSLEYCKLVRETIFRMMGRISVCEQYKPSSKNEEVNKEYHLSEYKRLLKQLEKL